MRRRRLARLLLVALVALVVLAALARGRHDLVTMVREHTRLMALVAALVLVGEVVTVRMPSGRVLAPVSSATALTLAVLGSAHGEGALDEGPWAVVLLVALCQGIAQLLRPRRDVALVAGARLLGVAAVAWLSRGVVVAGQTFTQWQADEGAPGWQIAGSLVLVALAGLLIERTLAALVQAGEHRRALTAVRGEYDEAVPFTLAVAAAPPMAALMAPVLGPVAVPLALVPVALTSIALRRYAAIGLTFRQTVRTLSRLTEEGGYTPPRHSERVADLARVMGERLGLGERDLVDLEYSALLHDLGQVALRAPFDHGATVHAAPADQRHIADQGARIVRRNPGLATAAEVIARQAVPYRAVVEDLEEVPLGARILKVANAFDDLTVGARGAERVDAALERIELGLGYEYDPEVVAALEAVVGPSARRL